MQEGDFQFSFRRPKRGESKWLWLARMMEDFERQWRAYLRLNEYERPGVKVSKR